MVETLLALCTGLVVGGLFRSLQLPIPAPITFSGVVGIFGIWLGFLLIERLTNG